MPCHSDYFCSPKSSCMYTGLLHLHSLLRWVLLILLIATCVKGYLGWINRYKFTEGDRKLTLYTLIMAHLQLVIGLVLYFISPLAEGARLNMAAAMKDPILRFWGVEHLTGMLIGIILITIGYSKVKRSTTDERRFRLMALYFIFALVIILLTIPWPWRVVGQGRGWF